MGKGNKEGEREVSEENTLIALFSGETNKKCDQS